MILTLSSQITANAVKVVNFPAVMEMKQSEKQLTIILMKCLEIHDKFSHVSGVSFRSTIAGIVNTSKKYIFLYFYQNVTHFNLLADGYQYFPTSTNK